MKKYMLISVVMLTLVTSLFGCSKKEPDELVIPKVEDKTPVAEKPEEKPDEKPEEKPEEKEIKPEKLGITGAWSTTYQGSAYNMILRENGTASIINGDNQNMDVLPNTPSDLLYEIEEISEDIYKIVFYTILIDCTDPTKNKMINGSEYDTLTVSIVDENNLQGTFNRNPEIYSFTKVNEALITASMGSSIFSDNGYKAVEVAVNYLKLQDSGLERIGYQGAQGTVYNEFYIFDTTFGGTTIFWYYVNTKDLRLFTETEYYNIVNP